MEENLQTMLDLIGQKFDMSFDQLNTNLKEGGFDSASKQSFNPENRSPILINENDKLEAGTIAHLISKDQALDHFDYQTLEQQKQSQIPKDVLTSKQQKQLTEFDAPQQSSLFAEKPHLVEGETVGLQGDDDDVEYYRTLNLKFEEALSKINSKKSFHSSTSDFFMQRLEHYEKKKSNQLETLRHELQAKEAKKYKDRPLINSKSHQIIPHHKPIQTRYKAVIQEKNNKIERQLNEKKRKQQEQKQKELAEIKEWEAQIKAKHGTIRSKEEYYGDQTRWNEKREKNIEQLAKKKQENIIAEVSCKPKINKRSDNMMKKKLQRVLIYEKSPEIKKIPIDQNCTFHPNLNKTLKK